MVRDGAQSTLPADHDGRVAERKPFKRVPMGSDHGDGGRRSHWVVQVAGRPVKFADVTDRACQALRQAQSLLDRPAVQIDTEPPNEPRHPMHASGAHATRYARAIEQRQARQRGRLHLPLQERLRGLHLVTKPDGKRARKYAYGKTREEVHDK
jgi:2-succinyl-5-enolpyruvyl-6-hydroxy-3-cyclohexene-1-carboxylate synthase